MNARQSGLRRECPNHLVNDESGVGRVCLNHLELLRWLVIGRIPSIWVGWSRKYYEWILESGLEQSCLNHLDWIEEQYSMNTWKLLVRKECGLGQIDPNHLVYIFMRVEVAEDYLDNHRELGKSRMTWRVPRDGSRGIRKAFQSNPICGQLGLRGVFECVARE